MGVLSGKDIFNSKWITAVITDSSSRLFFVPIKKTLGDYFVTELEGQEYVFKLDGSRLKTWRSTAAKSFRVLFYDTSHYAPIHAANNKELEMILQKNSLKKVDYKLFNVFKLLGHREKKDFTVHKLQELVDELTEEENEYAESVQNMKAYLDNLKVTEIVTPLRNISEFIEDDLITTDPKFLGTVISSYQRTDTEHKKITNSPVNAKIAWMKIIGIIAMIVAIVAVGYIVWSSGMLNNIVPTFTTPGNSSDELMKKYPTPEALKAAVDRGEVDYNKLPPDMKRLVDNVKLPTVTPTP